MCRQLLRCLWCKKREPAPHREESNHGLDGREGLERMPGELVELYASHGKIENRRVMKLAYGISGKAKLLTYDLKHLVRYGGILTALHTGTILVVDDGVLMEMLKLSFFFFAVAGGMYMSNDLETLQTMPTKPIAELANSMNGFVPFVLSLYVTLMLSRWWALRVNALGSVFDAVANTVMLVACVLPGPRHKVVRDLVVKWGVASIFLLVRAAREPEDFSRGGPSELLGLRHTLQGQLSDDEVSGLRGVSPYGRAMTMWAWIMRLAQETFSEASGPAPHAPKLTLVFIQCIKARDGIQTIHTYLQTQLPFAYVHLITLIVNVNNIVLSFRCAIHFIVAFAKLKGPDEYSVWESSYQMVCEVLMFMLVPVLYHGLLSISYVIHDPFGEDMLDFPIAAFVEYVVECCDAVLIAQDTFPGIKATKLEASESEGERSLTATRSGAMKDLSCPDAQQAVVQAATEASRNTVLSAVNAMHEISQATATDVRHVERELRVLFDAIVASEARRKRDAERLCAAALQKQTQLRVEPEAPTLKTTGKAAEPWCLNPEAVPDTHMIRAVERR